jgi:HSP20 family protein
MNMLTRRDTNRLPSIASWFENAFSSPFFTREMPISVLEEGTLPVDLSEDEKSVIVRASVPGFKKEDVEVEVEDGIVTINAKHTEEHEEKDERFYRKERSVSSLSRRVALPTAVIEKDARAELKDGVLIVRVPKTVKAQPKRIEIREG